MRDNAHPITAELSGELSRRLAGPQRHRLLHGYPLAGAMPRLPADAWVELPALDNPTLRPLLVGVLPHPFCNPRVPACGFCTFPHEAYRNDRVSQVVNAVCSEIANQTGASSPIRGRPVTGLYFGGGTANLTPPSDFRRLCRLLAARFELGTAEITLEGIPAMFLTRNHALLDILQEELPSRRIRLSMGLQTFDASRLRDMGRQAFGTQETFADVVEAAHARSWTASADLLVNLPGQSLAEMHADVAQAVSLGLDQICLYHLVLFGGMGSPWSTDENKLRALPSNETAASKWLALRQQLIDAGYVQTTLTNFERADVYGAGPRFLYEECSFRPMQFDMVGFGPGSITFQANDLFSRAVKTVNPESSADYLGAVDHQARIWDRYFIYEIDDLKVFYLTRRLAALEISLTSYWQTFGTDFREDFAVELNLLLAERLITTDHNTVRPTALGMFYADSIAGLLAHRRWQQLRLASASNRRSHIDRGAVAALRQSAGNENHRSFM